MMKHTQSNSPTVKRTIPATIAVYITTFILLTLLEVSLLTVVALIPKAAIKENTLTSASYYMENDVFYNINDRDRAGRIDHYADSILLNIIYNYDSKKPFSSSIKASYHHSDMQNENQNLMDTVSLDAAANYDYFRYWHGSAVIIRPLLTILSVKEIYVLLAIILCALAVSLGIMLFRYINPFTAAAFAISMAAVSCWYIPLSLEYIWCFLIMLVSCMVLLLMYRKKGFVPLMFFFVTGNITAYFDFLSTETITLIMPLAILVILRYDSGIQHTTRSSLLFILKSCCLWLAGYALSWLAKWSLASMVLGANVFTRAAGSAAVRMTGDTTGISGPAMSINGLMQNICCLLPFNLISGHAFAWVVLVMLIMSGFYFLFRKQKTKQKGMALPLSLLLLIPYIRYIFLANHSFLHYFFTYRAQAASIFCLCMIFYYNINWKFIRKKLH